MKKVAPFITLAIFCISLSLRLYRLDLLPLYADETGHYSLLATITQQKTDILSWIYNKLRFGSFTLVWIFGLTPIGVRSMSAFYSSSMVFLAYFFSIVINKNQRLAIVNSILVAILPWSFMIGRLGHTAIPILLVLVYLHIIIFLKSKTIRSYLMSLVPLFLASTYYPSMVIITPFILVTANSQVAKLIAGHLKNKYYSLAIIVTIIFFGFLFWLFGVSLPSHRALNLAIWRDVNTPYDTDRYRALSWSSQPSIFSFNLPSEQLANKLFLNRITANLSVFIRNYLSFFSIDWLFLKGDAILRHSTGTVGTFYPLLLPFMLYGVFHFFKITNSKIRDLFLVWILVSPIPAALTKDGAGYLLRVVTMLPFLTYFCALGVIESFSLIRRRLKPYYFISLLLISLYSIWSFLYSYFHVYPALAARSYEYGFKEISDFQVNNNGKTMLIVWDGYYPFSHFLFWQKFPFNPEAKIIPITIGETTFWKTLPSLYFGAPKNIKDTQEFIINYRPNYIVIPDSYFVKYPDNLVKLTSQKVSEILYPDETVAFTIYTVK